jgi:hypothetical protein
LTLDELKTRLQNHLGDGLVIVAGSGLSCAEGMPGMGKLANHLKSNVPAMLNLADQRIWSVIDGDIDSVGLEAALLKNQPTPTLESAILASTSALLLPIEKEIMEHVLRGNAPLRFTRLLQHLLKPNTGIPVITTNYDRLIEFATEAAGLGVDSMFVGDQCGKFDEQESRFSFCRDVQIRGKTVRYLFRPRVTLFKPHGSFDWYILGDTPIRNCGDIDLTRLIITPRLNKFRNGYDRPFDRHRERANQAIDNAARFLIIGYGFNDDHLETHLAPRIRAGVPTVLLTHSLSAGAKSLASSSSSFLGIEAGVDSGISGTRVTSGPSTFFFPGSELWELNAFINEVLQP